MDDKLNTSCPDCETNAPAGFDRRGFLKSVSSAATAAAFSGAMWAAPRAFAAPSPKSAAETAVKPSTNAVRGPEEDDLLRLGLQASGARPAAHARLELLARSPSRASTSDFYTKDQQAILFDIFKGIFNPDWHERFFKQLKDDHDGKPWGGGAELARSSASRATDQFEFVMTGRHMTIRADGNSAAHVALGGPIFHGHARQRLHREGAPPRTTSSGTRRSWPTRSTRSSTASSRSRPWSSSGPRTSSRSAFQGHGGKSAGPALFGDVARTRRRAAEGADEPDRAVPQGGPGRGAGVPEEAGRPRQVLRWRSTRTATSATTASGTTGGWRGRRSSGTSAATRTSTSGSTWPTIRGCRLNAKNF